MNKILTSIILLFLFNSCTSFFTEENKNIIEHDTLVMILADIQIADILLIQNRKFDRNLNDTTGKKSYYNFIFKKYNINEFRFVKTIEYYGQNTKEYSEVYTNVIDELSKRRAEVATPIDSTGNLKKDSLLKDSLPKDSLPKEKIKNLKNLKSK